MMSRRMGVVLWLLAGHALLGGVYWTLLNVPESNALALAASALLALGLLVGAGVIETTALVALNPAWSWRRAFARGVRLLPAFVLALLVWLAVSWMCGWLSAWHRARAGEMDAWLIATFDWTRTAGLHRAISYALIFIRYIIGLSLAVSLLAAAAFDGGGAVPRLRWIARAFAPWQLTAITAAVFGLIRLPWQWVYWRPRTLPASSLEVAFVGVKLLVIALLAHLGWAIVLWAAHRPSRQTRPPAAGVPEPALVPAPAPVLKSRSEEPLSS